MKKIMCIFGTRPEAIKLAPLIQTLKEEKSIQLSVCVTSQHKEMLMQVLDLFKIAPDYDLDVMRENQTLSDLMGSLISKISCVIDDFKPDYVIVHGDTSTTLAASLSAFYHKVTVVHVEAGLRTNDIYSPWPEEINRQCTGRIAKIHFAPTINAKKNLLAEGVAENSIYITGNTVIDALQQTNERIRSDENKIKDIMAKYSFIDPRNKMILVTGHRRENFGQAFENICLALKELSEIEGVQIVFPVHLNPHVQGCVKKILSNNDNVHLIDPVDYESFVFLLSTSYMVMTDSGGIQEEAPAFGKPVLVMRDTTERPEAIEAGTAILVGTDREVIVEKARELLFNDDFYNLKARAVNPFGDGTACRKIKEILMNV